MWEIVLAIVVVIAIIGSIVDSLTKQKKISQGAVVLDAFTFDKVLAKFPFALVKFDIAHFIDDNEFDEVAQFCLTIPDLLVAQVIVPGGQAAEIAKKYRVKKEDCPQLKLFVRGKNDPVNYVWDFKASEIMQFVRKNTGLSTDYPTCIDDSSEDIRSSITKRAEKVAEGLTIEQLRKYSRNYSRKMRSLVDEGDERAIQREINKADALLHRAEQVAKNLADNDFVQKERERVDELLRQQRKKKADQEWNNWNVPEARVQEPKIYR